MIKGWNAKAATEATLIKAAIGAVISEDGEKHFRELIQKLAPDED